VILRRCILIVIACSLIPAALQARLQAQDISPERRGLRILVEGDGSTIPMTIEEMRGSSRGSGFKDHIRG
jgi:hypothetical protein